VACACSMDVPTNFLIGEAVRELSRSYLPFFMDTHPAQKMVMVKPTAAYRQHDSTTNSSTLAITARAPREMDLQVFHLKDGKVVPFVGDQYVGLGHAISQEPSNVGGGSYWVHVDVDERNHCEMSAWIDSLNIESFISDQIERPAHEWLSHVSCTKLTSLVVIRTLHMTGKMKVKPHRVEYLAAVVTAKMLLTYTTSILKDRTSKVLRNALIDHMSKDGVLHEDSSSAALISCLEFYIWHTQNAAIALRNESMLMVKKMDEQPKTIKLEEILRIRDISLFVQGVAEEQNTCLDMLHDMDMVSDGVDFAKIEGALSMLVKTSEKNELLCKHLELRVNGLKNAFAAHQQDRLNRRLAMLTIVSAIFLPLTFLAGVYGMNFDNMPELHYEYSYFILWGSFWFVAVSMTLFFYLDGWFN